MPGELSTNPRNRNLRKSLLLQKFQKVGVHLNNQLLEVALAGVNHTKGVREVA